MEKLLAREYNRPDELLREAIAKSTNDVCFRN